MKEKIKRVILLPVGFLQAMKKEITFFGISLMVISNSNIYHITSRYDLLQKIFDGSLLHIFSVIIGVICCITSMLILYIIQYGIFWFFIIFTPNYIRRGISKYKISQNLINTNLEGVVKDINILSFDEGVQFIKNSKYGIFMKTKATEKIDFSKITLQGLFMPTPADKMNNELEKDIYVSILCEFLKINFFEYNNFAKYNNIDKIALDKFLWHKYTSAVYGGSAEII